SHGRRSRRKEHPASRSRAQERRGTAGPGHPAGEGGGMDSSLESGHQPGLDDPRGELAPAHPSEDPDGDSSKAGADGLNYRGGRGGRLPVTKWKTIEMRNATRNRTKRI